MIKQLKLSILTAMALHTTQCFASPSLQDMTLEEKVGQLLMVHFHGNVANEEARTLIRNSYVGGFIYYNWSNDLISPEQVRSLSRGLQKLTLENRHPIPLLIATDQEGGIVARIKGFTIFPGNKALGEAGDPELAESSAFYIGQELQAVGVNMNLAPVVDVNCNPRNPIIGIRSFGDNPEKVCTFAERALKGYHRAGIITSLKHFPGHGDVEIDSHQDLPIIKKSREELEKIELLPFTRLASQTDTIMTAHLLIPAIDPQNCSTLSSNTLNILRKEIGYEGVIISDSLVMEGVLKNCSSIDEAAIKAFNAGCDILLLGGKQIIGTDIKELSVEDIKRIHSSLVNGVKDGRISEERLNQSVGKILALKDRYPLLPLRCEQDKDSDPETNRIVNSTEHQALAKKIASMALKSIKNDPTILESLSKKNMAVFAPQIVHESINQTPLLHLGKETSLFIFNGLNPSENESKVAFELMSNADITLFCSYNAWKNPAQAALIQRILDDGKPMILIALRDPLDATLFPQAGLVITTFSPTEPSISAVCDLLCP